MKALFRPFLLLALALPLVLAACGSKEPEQRAAFTQFLQTRIVDKPGVRVPKLTEEEKKSFGDYAAQYAVITDFNAAMDASVKPMGNLMQKGAVRHRAPRRHQDRPDRAQGHERGHGQGTGQGGCRPRAAQAAR